MNGDLLDRLAAESARFFGGARVESILPRPAAGVALRFQDESGAALDLGCGPPRGWIGVCPGRLERGPGPSAGVLTLLDHRLGGDRLTAVRLLSGERIVRVDFAGGSSLVVELLGVRGNIYLLDGLGMVVARFRAVSRPGGVLAAGESWHPPRSMTLDPGSGVWTAPRSPVPRQPGLLSDGVLRARDPLAPLAVPDLRLCWDGPGATPQCFTPFRTLGEAQEYREGLLRRHAEAVARRQVVEGKLRRACRRLARLVQNLDREAAAASRHDRIRRQAEALLADLGRARRHGDQVEVRDPYDLDGGRMTLTVPAGVDLTHQAQVWFKQAGRLQRAVDGMQVRLEEARRRASQLEELLGRLLATETVAGLEEVLAEIPGWVPQTQQPRAAGRESLPSGKRSPLRQRRMERDPRARKIRRFKLVGGAHLLVGSHGPVNDFLTFRMARGHDFWLHAADHPGAHAILRNPSRQSHPAAPALRQAAQLAAYFSKAPRDLPVEVRWTQVKYLRKPKGLPPGTVFMPRFSTLLVRAIRPSEAGLPPQP